MRFKSEASEKKADTDNSDGSENKADETKFHIIKFCQVHWDFFILKSETHED